MVLGLSLSFSIAARIKYDRLNSFALLVKYQKKYWRWEWNFIFEYYVFLKTSMPLFEYNNNRLSFLLSTSVGCMIYRPFFLLYVTSRMKDHFKVISCQIGSHLFYAEIWCMGLILVSTNDDVFFWTFAKKSFRNSTLRYFIFK